MGSRDAFTVDWGGSEKIGGALCCCVALTSSTGHYVCQVAAGLWRPCLAWDQTEPRGPGQRWLDRVAQEGCDGGRSLANLGRAS